MILIFCVDGNSTTTRKKCWQHLLLFDGRAKFLLEANICKLLRKWKKTSNTFYSSIQENTLLFYFSTVSCSLKGKSINWWYWQSNWKHITQNVYSKLPVLIWSMTCLHSNLCTFIYTPFMKTAYFLLSQSYRVTFIWLTQQVQLLPTPKQ